MNQLTEEQIEKYYKGKYQQCPLCETNNQISTLGAGFRSCDECKGIFCFYCQATFQTQFEAFEHFLAYHKKDVCNNFQTSDLNKAVKDNYFIFFRFFKGNQEKITLPITYIDSVLEVKWRLYWLLNLDIQKARFIFAGKYLSNERILCHYGLQKESTCLIRMNEEPNLSIYVTVLNDQIREVKKIQTSRFRKKTTKMVAKYREYQLIEIDTKKFDNPEAQFNQFRIDLEKISNIPSREQIFFANGRRVFLKTVKQFSEFCQNQEQLFSLNVISINDFQKLNTFSSFSIDFLQFFKSQVDGDVKIGEYLVHQCFIEKRLSRNIEEINKILLKKNAFTQKQIYHFLKWIYSGKLNHLPSILPIFKKFKIKNVKEIDYMLAFKQLYEDVESKDFLMKTNNENENENEKEIKIHKFILWARCGVYKTMFQNLNENEKNISSITDFTSKSLQSIEMLLKFLYTNDFILTSNKNANLICDELKDAPEYYQFNENSIFKDLLYKQTNN
ncbi:speckle-type poz protein [Anaeramoeba flamelloides]|uniref:Speckle-type poz protein n=1 Tax=Anaeramoeba flamelloides TaxID=1746091 RepID=A0AAV7YFI1_9EUKA|nr:speckle-type poz protein [Anaeramoeba flamelloides]